ncbi:DUF5696 domain-containing protein [Paenibacillus sp. GCM10027626]|uniref:DUF5696 domain-containing protein n=1 Tax=Paenibacillus sp. GCM10027626 TaxID=3273411 RepID=UPI00362779B2
MKRRRIFGIFGVAVLLLVCGTVFARWSPAGGMPVTAAEKGAAEPSAEPVSAAAPTLKLRQPEEGAGLSAAAENERLRLYFDNNTGGAAIEDKATGSLFYTNPAEALTDAKASDAMKQELMSQIKLVYNVKGKEGEFEMNSYAQAMKLNQLSWAPLDDGLRVEMVLGREEQRVLLPQQITKETFDKEILATVAERDKKRLLAFYILYKHDELNGAKGKDLLAKYPILKDEDIYVLKTAITDRDKRVLEDYVKKAGFTYEKLEEAYERVGYDASEAVFPYFRIKLDYRLQGDSLTVTVHNRDIEYDKERFRLVRLTVLNYFGAGKTGEEGYLFLPDGSGTVIHFNNDSSKNTLLTTGKLYGPDYALSQKARGSFKQEFRTPVFGVKRGDSALFAVIEEGDAVAEINGMMGDINHSWNTAFASFLIRSKDSFIADNAFEQAPWVLYENKEYSGNIAMRYFFLTGERANYGGMAAAYREYLIRQGVLRRVEPKEDIPFYLETMGAVDTMVRRLGIPVQAKAAITSFDEAGEMLERLSGDGVRNIKLRYTGWYNGGFLHTAPSRMKVEGVLGGAKGLMRLKDKAAAAGAQIYPDVDFTTVSAKKAFDGFKPQKDGIRTLFQKVGYKSTLNLATQEVESYEWAIDPLRMLDYYRQFTADYDTLRLNAISLASLGTTLNSNFKHNREVNRGQAQILAADVLAQAAESYDDVMADGGNAYIFPAVGHILHLPDTDSSFAIADRQVPFIQMALHGYIQYASEPLNLASELRPALLKALEYGSSVYFKLNYGDSSLLKDAFLYDEVFASRFADWEKQAAEIYAELNAALRDVQNEAIVDHRQVQEMVYKTTYEHGKAIIVNYSDQKIQVEGIVVNPVDYAVILP